MTPSFRRAFVLLAVAAQSGCRSAVPEQILTKAAPTIITPASGLRAGPWAPRPTGVGSSYAIVQTAAIRIEQDSLIRVDTVASHTDVFLALSPGGRFAGTVTAFSTRGTGPAFATPPGVTLPASFSGTITPAGTIELTLPAPDTACVSSAPAVVLSARDLWLRAPDTVRIGATWGDSSTTVMCRDGIPLRMRLRRSYRVERADTSGAEVAIVVSRMQDLVLDGAGKQWGEDVRVTGTGTGDMLLRLSAGTGMLLNADGRGTLELTFAGSRTLQRVHQQAEVRVRPVTGK